MLALLALKLAALRSGGRLVLKVSLRAKTREQDKQEIGCDIRC